jgi:hypothetical protein
MAYNSIKLLNSGKHQQDREQTFLNVGVGLRLKVMEQQMRELMWMVKLTKANPHLKDSTDKYAALHDLCDKHNGQMFYQIAEMEQQIEKGFEVSVAHRDEELQPELEQDDNPDQAILATQQAQRTHHIPVEQAEDIDLAGNQGMWDAMFPHAEYTD